MRPGSGLHSVPPSLKPHFQQLRLVLEAVEKLGYPNLQVVFFLGFFPYGPSPLNTAATSNLFIPLSGLVRTPKLGPPPPRLRSRGLGGTAHTQSFAHSQSAPREPPTHAQDGPPPTAPSLPPGSLREDPRPRPPLRPPRPL